MSPTHYHIFVGKNRTVLMCRCGLRWTEYQSIIEHKYPGWW